MDSLVKLLLDKGFNVVPVFNTTDHIRFDRGGPMSGYFKGWSLPGKHGQVLSAGAHFGDWSTGEKHSWSGGMDTSNMTPTELEAAAKLRAEFLAAEKAAKAERQRLAAIEANRLYAQAVTDEVETHPYIVRKGIAPGSLVRRLGDLLYIPVTLPQQGITSVQTIDPKGEKRFLSGGRLAECVTWWLPAGQESMDFWPKEIYVCEGYATAASVGMALNSAVLVAFNTSNLVKVAHQLARAGAQSVVICADNDNKRPGVNPGLDAAQEAGRVLTSAGVACKVIAPKAEAGTAQDWNDTHVAHGLDAVRKALLGEEMKEEKVGEESAEEFAKQEKARALVTMQSILGAQPIEPLPWRTIKGKKNLCPPSQDTVASTLSLVYGPHLMREKKDVFLWCGTHWIELDPDNFKSYIRGRAQILMSCEAKDNELNAFYNMLMDKLPVTEHTMFRQDPRLANFLDGTLEIVQSKDRSKYEIRFREHRREDLLTWVLPYEYKAPRPKNAIFETWLERCFAGDADKEGKIRALKQVGGACLIALFPRTAFLHGEAGTGKSTFAKLCAAFVGRSNRAGVQPSQMKAGHFMMETLINKQVNIVTDISDDRIDSAIFKQIEDRMEFHINRKHKKAVMAFIPALHLFCGNTLPRGIDGTSGAMDRRITIVEFLEVVKEIESGDHTREFEQVILSGGPGAILQFMEDGLADLCASGGVYFNPATGREKLKQWKLNNDPVGLFFEAISEGEFSNIYLHRDASIRCSELWVAFQKYRHDQRLWSSIGRNSFYDAVCKRGYPRKADRNDVMHYHGVGVLGRDLGPESPGNTGNTGGTNGERF